MHENFFHKIKVYYEDTDSGGVVYYANYLKFLERARSEAIYSLGYTNLSLLQSYGVLLIVKSCNIEYKKSAYLEDELTIRSFVKTISKTSFSMNQIVTRGDDKIVDAYIQLVFVDKKGKPKKIPEEIYSKFKPYFCDTIKS